MHDPLLTGEDLRQVTQDMLGLAVGLQLAPAHWGLPRVGAVVYLHRGITALDYGHEDCLVNIPAQRTWYEVATSTRHVHVSVGLDPRPDGEGTDARLFADVAAATGRLWSGIATART